MKKICPKRLKARRIWRSMRSRCDSVNNSKKVRIRYRNRGVRVCKEWEDFNKFFEDMGPCPDGLSLDRINNDLGYFKENCRWATKEQQANNKSTNKFFTLNGETRTYAQWARYAGIKRQTLERRVREMGMSFEEALSTGPMRPGPKPKWWGDI